MAQARIHLRLCAVIWLASHAAGSGAQASAKSNPGTFECGQPATLISTVQGAGTASPLTGTVVDVQAVVVGVFQKRGELGGLFIEEEDTDHDRNAHTSEGIFARTKFPARTGDVVRLRGRVTEFEGLTELQPVYRLQVCARAGALPEPTALQLPMQSSDGFEATENMLVTVPQTLIITDIGQLWKFGELVVSSTRLVQPTQAVTPGRQAAERAQSNGRDQLVIDDGRTGRKLPVSFHGQDNGKPFSADNPIRTGQEISRLSGVLHFGFGRYRLQPTQPFTIREAANPRSPAPRTVGGSLRVGVFNVGNYFSTTGNSGAVCGPSGNQICRGAYDAPEQELQKQKLSAALGVIDAGILALVEMENDPERSLRDVANALNDRAGRKAWSYVRSGSIGREVIKVGLLFNSAAVIPAGPLAILDRSVDVRFDDTLNRPALAQSFRIAGNGAFVTVIVTHLKSKNCRNASGADKDNDDGQGCFNRTRARAAEALADWAASDPTGTAAPFVLLLGDFNSYGMEEPVQILARNGLIDLLAHFASEPEYTFVYGGLAGTLDYVFSNPALAEHVTGATVWHINADESSALDYRHDPAKPKQYSAGNPFRSSDHDPVIIGLDIGSEASAITLTSSPRKPAASHYFILATVAILLTMGVCVPRRRQAATMPRRIQSRN